MLLLLLLHALLASCINSSSFCPCSAVLPLGATIACLPHAPTFPSWLAVICQASFVLRLLRCLAVVVREHSTEQRSCPRSRIVVSADTLELIAVALVQAKLMKRRLGL